MAQILDTIPVTLAEQGVNYSQFYVAVVLFAAGLGTKGSRKGLAYLVLNPKDLAKVFPTGIPVILTPLEGGGPGHYEDKPPTGFGAAQDLPTWKHHNAIYIDHINGETALKAALIDKIGVNNMTVLTGDNPLAALFLEIRDIMDKLEATYNVATEERLARYDRIIAGKWHSSNGRSIAQHIAILRAAFQERADMLGIPVDRNAEYNAMRASLLLDANFLKSLADHYDHDTPLTARNIDNLTAYMLLHFPALANRSAAYAAAAVDTTVTDPAIHALINAAVAKELQSRGIKPAAGGGAQRQQSQSHAPTPKATPTPGILYCSKHGYSYAVSRNGRPAGHAGADCDVLRATNAPASQKNATAHKVNSDGTVEGSWKGFGIC